jgi:hypothetical protein
MNEVAKILEIPPMRVYGMLPSGAIAGYEEGLNLGIGWVGLMQNRGRHLLYNV